MSDDIKCSRCEYKIPREICGSSESPYYNKKIEPNGSCSYFLINAAQDHFEEGLHKLLSEDKVSAIKEFEMAIKLGLPQDDEMLARFFLGECYWGISSRALEGDIYQKSSIEEMEKAVLIDYQGGYGYFSEKTNRARLQSLDIGYAFQARSIREKEGDNAAIAYLQQKLKLLDYLPTNPMLTMLFDLGSLYGEKGENSIARECYKKILEADIVDPVDETGFEAEIRQKAAHNLQVLEVKDKKCFIATAVYGGVHAPEVDIFRRFRDEILLPHYIGRKFVSIYYLCAPHIARLIEKSAFSKSLVKTIFLKPAIWLISSKKSIKRR